MRGLAPVARLLGSCCQSTAPLDAGAEGDAADAADTPSETDGTASCPTDRYLPAASRLIFGPWPPTFIFETPTGFAWIGSDDGITERLCKGIGTLEHDAEATA